MPAKNPRINVVLEQPLYREVQLLAKNDGVSMSTKVRDLLREILETQEDIAVLLATSPAEPLKFELTLEGDLEKSVHIPVDMRVLNHAPQPFQYNVIREGKLILDRDPNRRAAFEGNVIKQYLDFSRFRRRSLREIAIAEF
jgi:predicted nucleotidyltransferase